MKYKGFFHNFLLVLFVALPIVLGYYIFVNTVLAKSVLPNVKVNSQDISFLSEDELKKTIEIRAMESLPERLEVDFEGERLSVGLNDINVKVDTYEMVNFGKGDNIFKVISDGISLLRGIDVEVDYTLDIELFLNKLGIFTTSPDASSLVGSQLLCNANNFNMTVNSENLKVDVINAIKYRQILNLDLSQYIKNPEEKLVYQGCRKYQKDSISIKSELLNNISEVPLDIDDVFYLKVENNKAVWQIREESLLDTLLANLKTKRDVEPDEGQYEVLSDRILLFKQYINGSVLDKEASLLSIEQWLNSDNLRKNPLVYIQTTPAILSWGKPILDFTKELSVGTSRIELIRNGADNFVIPYTMFGLDEINNTIIGAGEEFSYIKSIDPQPNSTTKSGRPIAPGICNSTTTLFRAVLEAGLQITDRSSHGFYVPSYEWGYDYNIVDAAYYTNPTVDFKFKNDTEYPILLKVEYAKDADYQYNTVKIFSSSQAKKREIELTNWKIWDKWSNTNFKGSFDRVVRADGVEIFRDNFYSHFL